jgi:hypothetical protein
MVRVEMHEFASNHVEATLLKQVFLICEVLIHLCLDACARLDLCNNPTFTPASENIDTGSYPVPLKRRLEEWTTGAPYYLTRVLEHALPETTFYQLSPSKLLTSSFAYPPSSAHPSPFRGFQRLWRMSGVPHLPLSLKAR